MLKPENMALENLKQAELNLKESILNRAGAIALTHIQTAILWLWLKESLEKDYE